MVSPISTSIEQVRVDTPDISPIRSPRPPLIPTMPICPSGFWSNHSVINSRAYCRVRSNRVGRISRSIMADERSSSRTRWRMIVRRMAAAGASRLPFTPPVSSKRILVRREETYRLRLPRAMRSSTAPCRLPASSSCTVSHERVYEASHAYGCF